MKKQGRNSQDQINKEKISKLPEKQFRITTVKMFQSLKSTMQTMPKTINTINAITKDIEEIKRDE